MLSICADTELELMPCANAAPRWRFKLRVSDGFDVKGDAVRHILIVALADAGTEAFLCRLARVTPFRVNGWKRQAPHEG